MLEPNTLSVFKFEISKFFMVEKPVRKVNAIGWAKSTLSKIIIINNFWTLLLFARHTGSNVVCTITHLVLIVYS